MPDVQPYPASGPDAVVDHAEATGSSRWPGVIVGIATVLAIVSVFTVWTRSQMLDTDEWVDLSADLVAEPEVQAALAGFLIDSLYERANITAAVEERLPPELQGLAGFVSGALRDPLTTDVERLLVSDRFQSLWETANRTAHETLVNILRDETRTRVATAEGVVAVGWSLAGVGFVILLAQAVARRVLLDALVENPANGSAADITAGVATGLLRQMGWAALIYGILIATFAWLRGEHRWAVAVRRTLAPVFDLSTSAVAGGTVVMLLVVWAWSPGRVFEGWATGLTFVGLVIAAVVALRARVRRDAMTGATQLANAT